MDRVQALGETLDCAARPGVAAVHPYAHQVAAQRQRHPPATRLEPGRETHVFEHLAPDQSVSTHPQVGRSTEGHQLPVSGAHAGKRQPGDRRRQDAQQHVVDQGGQQAFAPLAGLLARPDGQQVGARRFQFEQQRGQRARFPAHVGVGEDQHLTSGGLSELHAGPWLAVPAGRPGLPREEPRSRNVRHQIGGDAGGIVARLVIENQDLQQSL